MGVQWLTWRVWMGAAAFLSCGNRKMEKHWIYANSPGHDSVRGCNERTFRVSFSHFNDLSTISHVNQFQDFRHVHFSTICQQFRMPTHFNIFNNLPNLEVANDVQQFFGRICGRKICESLVRGCTVYCTTLNLLEHLNLSWNNACACEHSRNLVGTIWTIGTR